MAPSGTWGNAVDWIKHSSYNHSPAVGSIAWWGSEVAGGYGHVAYVDQVNGSQVHVIADNYIGQNSDGYTSSGWIAASSVDEFLHPHDVVPAPTAPAPTAPAVIGTLTNSGEVYAKEGGLSAAWVDEFGGATQIAVASDGTNGPLIAVLTGSGEVYAKEGGLSAAWVDEFGGATQIAVASDSTHGPLIAVHGRVGDEGEAQRLVDLVVEVSAPDVTLVGEEQVATQGVQALALVQLAAYSASEFFVGDVAAEVDGADESAVFLQRSGKGVLSAAGVELGDEQARGGVLGDRQVGRVPEDLIKHCDRLAPGGRDDLGAVGRVLVGNVGVGGGALVEEVARQGAGGEAATALREPLPVRGRQRAAAPQARERVAVVGVHQAGVRLSQRVLAQVPLRGPGGMKPSLRKLKDLETGAMVRASLT